MVELSHYSKSKRDFVMNYAALFEEQIRVQKQAIRSSELCAGGFFLVGAAVILFTLVVNLDKSLTIEAIKLGGGVFLSCLSFYQIKDIIPRLERIASYTYLNQN